MKGKLVVALFLRFLYNEIGFIKIEGIGLLKKGVHNK